MLQILQWQSLCRVCWDVKECRTTKCHDNNILYSNSNQRGGLKPMHESKFNPGFKVPVWYDIVTHTDMWEVLTKRFFQNPLGTFMNKSRNMLWTCRGCHKGERKHKTSVTPLLMEKQSLWLLGVIPAVFGISEDTEGKVVDWLVNRPLSCFVQRCCSWQTCSSALF